MLVSARTVAVTTLGPLTLIVFVFAILFTDSYHQGNMPDCCFSDECEMPESAMCPNSPDCDPAKLNEGMVCTPDWWNPDNPDFDPPLTGDYSCSSDPNKQCSLIGAHTFFGSMGKSMKSLIIMGTIL